MRRTLHTLALAAVVLVAGAVLADDELQDQIDEQAAIVAAEQAQLDSLCSLALAVTLQAAEVDQDTTGLAAAGVTIEVASPAAVTGSRDRVYVDVVLPQVAGWDAITRRLLAVELREANLGATVVEVGRYRLHHAEVPALLRLYRAYLLSLAEDPEE